jgi:hypothetical protein
MNDAENAKAGQQENPNHGIMIWLDTYDDIFSDFDSRSYDHRALSDDFISEIRKISLEDESDIREFHLLMPAASRNKESETIIIKRLQHYFRKTHQRLHAIIISQQKKALLFIVCGLFFLLLGGYISFLKPTHLLLHLLMITCEPAGWFLVWMGYDLFANGIKRKKSELTFYRKTTDSDFIFLSLDQKK